MDKCYICNNGTIKNLKKILYVKTGIISKDKYVFCIDCFEQVPKVMEKRSKWMLHVGWSDSIHNLVISDEILQFIKNHKNDIKNHFVNVAKKLNDKIIALLAQKTIKMPASDIDAHLKWQNVNEIKEMCEDMYHNGIISRTGNYRYFILNKEKKKSKPKKDSASKSKEVDVEKELEKYKGLLDKGLITQEQYDAKSNELLGL